MSISEIPAMTAVGRGLLNQEAPPKWLVRIDRRLEELGELLNPILVKECRECSRAVSS